MYSISNSLPLCLWKILSLYDAMLLNWQLAIEVCLFVFFFAKISSLYMYAKIVYVIVFDFALFCFIFVKWPGKYFSKFRSYVLLQLSFFILLLLYVWSRMAVSCLLDFLLHFFLICCYCMYITLPYVFVFH